MVLQSASLHTSVDFLPPPFLHRQQQQHTLHLTNMSESEDTNFSETQSTSASDEERDDSEQQKRLTKSRRALPAKRSSLQKRTKPALTRHRAPKAADPFDDAVLFKPSETMDEEMNAMKQVFLRMSEKKLQQKEERKAECKRLYKEAFHADVEQIFRKAAKSRSRSMDQVSNEIDGMKSQLKSASEELLNGHAAYKNSSEMELSRARSQMDQLRSILADLDMQYAAAQEKIELEYHEVTQRMEASMQQLEIKLTEAYENKSFFSSFRPQVERILQ